MIKKINEKKLSASLAESLNLDQEQVLKIIQKYFEATSQYLKEEKMQAIPHLGTFKLRWHDAYESYNPNLQKEIEIPARYWVRFHMALSLQKKLNQDTATEEETSDLSEPPKTELSDALFDEQLKQAVEEELPSGQLASEKKELSNGQLTADASEKKKIYPDLPYQHQKETEREEFGDLTEEEMKDFLAQEVEISRKRRTKKRRLIFLVFISASISLGIYYFVSVENRVEKPNSKISVASALAPPKGVNFEWGDTLAKIAEREYGNKILWPYLYFENSNTISSPFKLIPIKDKVFIKYQTNQDLGQLYFELFKTYRGQTVEADFFLIRAHKLNPKLILRHISELSPEEKELINTNDG